MEPWIIPFDGINYVVYRDSDGQKYRKLSPEEEKLYFLSSNKEKCLNDILRRG